MPRPNHGALGLSFLACRALQFVCLIVAMAMTARFISVMIDNMQQPPPPVVGILAVVCFAILYTLISVILYWDRQLPLLPTAAIDGLFFIALMVSSIVIGKPLSYISCKSNNASISNAAALAATGAYTPYVTPAPNTWTPPTAVEQVKAATTTAVSYVTSTVQNAVVAATVPPGGKTQVYGSDGQLYSISASRFVRRHSEESAMRQIAYGTWIKGASTNTCMMMKAVWGFGIALTILFVFSMVCIAFIWKNERMPKKSAKTADSH